MIIEYTYSPQDLKKKCFGCKWLTYEEDAWDNFSGLCECPHNKVKFRNRISRLRG